jgi:photosystem II stability/assembly factor-like uncharacterized protein
MSKSKIILGFALLALTAILSGCVSFKTSNTASTNDGGVYKSIDKGTTWAHKVVIPTASGKPASFAAVNDAALAVDPNDAKAIYFGSVGSGLLYTYDAAATWQVAKGLENTTVRAVAVAPGAKCVIYAAVGNKLLKSADCNRTWAQVYFDTDLTVTVDALVIDPKDSDVLYIGVSRGDIIKSTDQGDSWQTVQRLKDKIVKIIIDPANSKNMYVITAKKGVYHTTDGGTTVDTKLNDVLKGFKFNLVVKDMVFVPGEPGVIFLAASYGLLKSSDNGANWDKVELITPEKFIMSLIRPFIARPTAARAGSRSNCRPRVPAGSCWWTRISHRPYIWRSGV